MAKGAITKANNHLTDALDENIFWKKNTLQLLNKLILVSDSSMDISTFFKNKKQTQNKQAVTNNSINQ
ncbi:MAG: hypothetical protein WC150_11055 [Bacteroidia bacterium]